MKKLDSIFAAFQTTLEMLKDREYYIPNEIKNLKKDEMKLKYLENSKNGFNSIFSKIDSKEEKLLMSFKFDESILKKEDLSTFTKKMKEDNILRGIIIGFEDISIIVKKCLKEINSKTNYTLEYFKIEDLEFNITKNEIIPKHYLVSKTEKKMVLKKYNIKEKKLPKILLSDPMSCYLGLKKGDMVKILRASPQIGHYIFYRICVD